MSFGPPPGRSRPQRPITMETHGHITFYLTRAMTGTVVTTGAPQAAPKNLAVRLLDVRSTSGNRTPSNNANAIIDVYFMRNFPKPVQVICEARHNELRPVIALPPNQKIPHGAFATLLVEKTVTYKGKSYTIPPNIRIQVISRAPRESNPGVGQPNPLDPERTKYGFFYTIQTQQSLRVQILNLKYADISETRV